MALIVMACIVMAYTVIAYAVIAHAAIVYTAMTHVFMPFCSYGLYGRDSRSYGTCRYGLHSYEPIYSYIVMAWKMRSQRICQSTRRIMRVCGDMCVDMCMVMWTDMCIGICKGPYSK